MKSQNVINAAFTVEGGGGMRTEGGGVRGGLNTQTLLSSGRRDMSKGLIKLSVSHNYS